MHVLCIFSTNLTLRIRTKDLHSIVRSRRPVVVPIECPLTQNHMARLALPNWKSQNRHCIFNSLNRYFYMTTTARLVEQRDCAKRNKIINNLPGDAVYHYQRESISFLSQQILYMPCYAMFLFFVSLQIAFWCLCTYVIYFWYVHQ